MLLVGELGNAHLQLPSPWEMLTHLPGREIMQTMGLAMVSHISLITYITHLYKQKNGKSNVKDGKFILAHGFRSYT